MCWTRQSLNPGGGEICQASCEDHWASCTLGRVQLRLDGTCTETRFRLLAKRTSPCDLAGATIQSTTGSRGVRVSCAGEAMLCSRGRHAGYPLHSPVAPSFPLPCVTVCHIILTALCLVSLPGVKKPGHGINQLLPHSLAPLLVPRLCVVRAIPLPALCACMSYYRMSFEQYAVM
jgi:hypothetical protein